MEQILANILDIFEILKEVPESQWELILAGCAGVLVILIISVMIVRSIRKKDLPVQDVKPAVIKEETVSHPYALMSLVSFYSS